MNYSVQSTYPLSLFYKDGAFLPLTFHSDSNEILRVLDTRTSVTLASAPISSDTPRSKKIGVLFSGGPAPGGHNVICGIHAMLGTRHSLFGILNGPKGLITQQVNPITADDCARILNTGGFHFLGTDRLKLTTEEHLKQAAYTVQKFRLDGLILIGGEGSNVSTHLLARYLAKHRCTVVGVPKTIDNDLQFRHHLPVSFGFDTAAGVYSNLVFNLILDAESTRKYWHFVKVMGRSASHLSLEIAHRTHAPICLISEEIRQRNESLQDVAVFISDQIETRYRQGKPYGVCVIPEGLFEHISSLKNVITELNDVLPRLTSTSILSLKEKLSYVLSPASFKSFATLPNFVQEALLSKRDPHGNVNLSLIKTELLMMSMVQHILQKRGIQDIQFFDHFFGYEGRCSAPSPFDSSYGFNLGLVAGNLVLDGHTDHLAAIDQLGTHPEPIGIPLSSLIQTSESATLTTVPKIPKTLVSLKDPAFTQFETQRKTWLTAPVGYRCFSPQNDAHPNPLYHLPFSTRYTLGLK